MQRIHLCISGQFRKKVGEKNLMLAYFYSICRTVGEKPGPPPGGEFLVVNSTLVILLLERWLTPSCPILYFVIEYKLAIEHSWTVGRRRTKTNTVTVV
jgi:hypothetical protein